MINLTYRKYNSADEVGFVLFNAFILPLAIFVRLLGNTDNDDGNDDDNNDVTLLTEDLYK